MGDRRGDCVRWPDANPAVQCPRIHGREVAPAYRRYCGYVDDTIRPDVQSPGAEDSPHRHPAGRQVGRKGCGDGYGWKPHSGLSHVDESSRQSLAISNARKREE